MPEGACTTAELAAALEDALGFAVRALERCTALEARLATLERERELDARLTRVEAMMEAT